MSDANHSLEPLERLQAGLLFLMNKYAGTPCRGVAGAIATQLEEILTHPHIELFPAVHRQCANSVNSWRARAHGISDGAGSRMVNLH